MKPLFYDVSKIRSCAFSLDLESFQEKFSKMDILAGWLLRERFQFLMDCPIQNLDHVSSSMLTLHPVSIFAIKGQYPQNLMGSNVASS